MAPAKLQDLRRMAADRVLDEVVAARGKWIRLGLGVGVEVDGFAVQQQMPDRKPKQDRRIRNVESFGSGGRSQ
jgi:hypothetical protein